VVRAIRRAAIERLIGHDWPGNVRELEAVLTRAAHLAGPGGTIECAALGSELAGARAHGQVRDRLASLRGRTLAYEAELIRTALVATSGNRSLAARSLGITRQGLWKKMRRLGVRSEEDVALAE